MADKADKPASGTKSQDSDTIFNSDIGDDWGEAFASEEDMFSSEDETSSPFFLDENEDDPGSPSPAAEKATAKAPAPIEGESNNAPRPFVSTLLQRLSLYIKTYKDKFLSLSKTVKLTIGGASLAGIVVILILAGGQNHQINNDQAQVETPTPTVVVVPPESTTKSPTGDNRLTIPPQVISEKAVKPANNASIEKSNKKWHLPLFFIAVMGADGKKSTILTVDLTLLLLLHKDELPPTNREIATRDIIFQFFNNQPLSEIRRYSLARGDMNRKLRAWIEKQLPDLPLSTIIFNRYQIL